MTQLQTTAIIRQRGQLTLPEIIRASRKWADTDSVVTITSDSPDVITIKPHSPKKEVDWDKIWDAIKRARAIRGKNKISSTEFIAQDRLTGHSI